VRTQSPLPEPGSPDTRTDRFYYDGVRRVVEIQTDTVASMAMASEDPDPETQTLAAESVSSGITPDEDATPLTLEAGLIDPVPGLRGIAREYIWGPGGSPSGGGLDELLVQYDNFGDAWWAIHDAGGDLVALCDLGGGDAGGGHARVVAQWTWDAYGDPVSADHIHPFTLPRLGHKGLFLDRLDVGVDSGGAELPRLVPFARVVYHNRNRAYAPSHGRFMQRDPNATAVALIEASASHGSGMGAVALAFSMEDMYGDGMNLYDPSRAWRLSATWRSMLWASRPARRRPGCWRLA